MAVEIFRSRWWGEKKDCSGIAASSAAEDITGELKIAQGQSVSIPRPHRVGTGLRQYRPIEAFGLDTKTSQILKG